MFHLFDEEANVLRIKGTHNLKEELLFQLDDNENAAFFEYKEDKMFYQRESELIQRYLQEHDETPGDGDDDDLFLSNFLRSG